MPLWAWHRPYTHCGCMDELDTPGSWCRVGMPAVCTVGPRVNADNGRSDVPQEPKSLQASAKVYYVLGEWKDHHGCIMYLEQLWKLTKSQEPPRGIAGTVSVSGKIFETWFFNIPSPLCLAWPNSCSTHFMNILGQGNHWYLSLRDKRHNFQWDSSLFTFTLRIFRGGFWGQAFVLFRYWNDIIQWYLKIQFIFFNYIWIFQYQLKDVMRCVRVNT